MRLKWLGLGILCAACGGTGTGFDNDGGKTGRDGGGDGNASLPDGEVTFGDSGPPTDSGPSDGCSDAAKLVYTIATDNVLRSFNPATLQFKTIGTLNCGTFESPNSMAVSRDATAYVNMSDGTLWKVSTTDASCQPTSYQLDQSNRRIRGMGFSSDVVQGTAETLYTCTADDSSGNGGGLAKIALPSFQLTPIGDYSNGLGGNECELTGTGNAQLFGFFATLSPPKLAEIDKASAATPSPITLTGVDTTLAYAFSFWGGDFWFYTQGNGIGSTVTHYAYATTKTFSTAIADTGFTIVGAGVSTCAPVSPPN
ncbi:MAG TPA: hypothetical protein VGH28_27205 [Polyangiaceae bacterium]|jgi:hypothetical protein